ncbi:hypothetical protein CEXT_550681 [Caerostris extrusa]|uniref:Uncharacterized protein n=1 Tax=Caerostris extrusa TaxID=172846 RepID=A0AAV4YCY7_CAEEX|nr:hypothetical protein CEXT_550681 [Caerostris extrusa]
MNLYCESRGTTAIHSTNSAHQLAMCWVRFVSPARARGRERYLRERSNYSKTSECGAGTGSEDRLLTSARQGQGKACGRPPGMSAAST